MVGVKQTRTEAVADIMRTTTSITRPELLRALSERGVPTTDEQLTVSWHHAALGDLAQIEIVDPPLVVNLPAALTGRVFTHRLTAAEIEADELATVPDFAAIWPLLDTPPFNRLDGELIEDAADEDSLAPVIRLAASTLTGYPADSLIAISVVPDGLHLESVPEPDEQQRLAQTLGFSEEFMEVFGAAEVAEDVEPVGAIPLEEYLLLVCARHPELFAEPGWPVTDILIRQRLDHEDGMVAVAGFDFAAANAETLEAEEFERISQTYELADVESLAVLAFTAKVDELHDAMHGWADDGESEEDFPEVEVVELLPHLPALAEPMVSVAIADESLGGDPHLGAMLAMILETIRPQTPRRALAGWHWLLGRCQDLLADFPATEAAYLKALEMDADFYPSMRELASLASLRGDAGRAVSLLQRAAVPADDPELLMVSRYVGDTRTDVGRNDPCWCGSGRKYKRCHLGRSDFDLAARRDWLYDKVSTWVRNGVGRELLIELAAASVDPAAGPEALFGAVLNPLLMDIAIFEGGLLDEFIDTRAAALPPDERDLLTDWSASRRGLFLVESTDRAGSFIVRDASSGAMVTVLGEAAGTGVGDLVSLRALPADGSWAAPGGVVPVATEQRELVAAMLELQGTRDVDPVRTATVLTVGNGGAQRGPAGG